MLFVVFTNTTSGLNEFLIYQLQNNLSCWQLATPIRHLFPFLLRFMLHTFWHNRIIRWKDNLGDFDFNIERKEERSKMLRMYWPMWSGWPLEALFSLALYWQQTIFSYFLHFLCRQLWQTVSSYTEDIKILHIYANIFLTVSFISATV